MESIIFVNIPVISAESLTFWRKLSIMLKCMGISGKVSFSRQIDRFGTAKTDGKIPSIYFDFQHFSRKEQNKNMTKTIKQIWNWISGVLVGIVVLLAIALVGVRLIGLQPFVVLSGSMEPTYHVGSLIYVKSVDYKQLQVGDPITYMISQDTVVTHRIIEVLVDEEDPDTIRYFTKGDANAVADGTSVHYRNIIGKPVFSIPYLGYVSNYVQNPPGMYVAMAAGAILILLVFLPDVFADEEESEKKKRK